MPIFFSTRSSIPALHYSRVRGNDVVASVRLNPYRLSGVPGIPSGRRNCAERERKSSTLESCVCVSIHFVDPLRGVWWDSPGKET